MRRDGFIQCHVHSEHSAFDGMTKVKALIERTARFGVPAMALTDHGVVTGWQELHKYAHAAGVLPIFGIEAYVVEDRTKHIRQPRRHLVLLAISHTGVQNLTTLVTLSAMYHYYKPLMDPEILARYSEGIIASTACLGGWVARPFFSTTGYEGAGEPVLAERELGRLRDIFGDRLYLEVQPYAQGSQRVFNDWAFDLHERTGQPLLATNDVHYLEADDAQTHPYFIMAGMGAWQRRGGDGYTDGVEKYVSKPGGTHYRTRQEMVDAFAALHGEGVLRRPALWSAIEAPWEVYDRAAAVRFETSLKIPVYLGA